MQRRRYCEGKVQQKLVHRIKRIHGQVNVLERSLSMGEVGEDVLLLLANVRGGINSLLVEILTSRIRSHLSKGRVNSSRGTELEGTLVDLVRAYLK